jgi:hypothetical protein
MKANVLITLASCAAFTLACSARTPAPASTLAPTPQTSPPPPQPYVVEWSEQSVTNFAEYRDLLFVDETLEEFTNPARRHPLPPLSPWEDFARAGEAVRAGRAAEAKKALRAGMEHPETEVRARLWAWNALRELGEKPPPEIAREVHGVVLEVPVGEWLDVLAVYSDGKVRYLNEKRGVLVWEHTGESEVNTLAAKVLTAAGPLVGKSRAIKKHLPMSMSVTRVTVLTYSGIYVAEGDPEAPPDEIAPVFNVGTRLFLTLLERQEEQEQGAPQRPAPGAGEGK